MTCRPPIGLIERYVNAVGTMPTMKKYPFREIEQKWQRFWEEHETFKAVEDPTIPKERRRYVLDMFPYPSAAGLHVGHPEGYTATDIYCRYLRMNGYNVLHPMGFDSFGLPAENYAVQTGTHPKTTTDTNIDRFREQIKSLGFGYDWSREISTPPPGLLQVDPMDFSQAMGTRSRLRGGDPDVVLRSSRYGPRE